MGPWPLFHRMGEHDVTAALDIIHTETRERMAAVQYHGDRNDCIDRAVRDATRHLAFPDDVRLDPRYIQHCKEQDMKEEGPADWFKQSLMSGIDAND